MLRDRLNLDVPTVMAARHQAGVLLCKTKYYTVYV